MATDPVCGMNVDPAKASGSFAFEGKTYYFCSSHCLAKFKADPAGFVGAPRGAQKVALAGAHGDQQAGGGAGRWVFWGFILIIGYFLVTEHRAHVVQYLPFLLLLACPLMHLFHGHGGHGGHGRDEESKDRPAKPGSEKKHSGGCH